MDRVSPNKEQSNHNIHADGMAAFKKQPVFKIPSPIHFESNAELNSQFFLKHSKGSDEFLNDKTWCCHCFNSTKRTQSLLDDTPKSHKNKSLWGKNDWLLFKACLQTHFQALKTYSLPLQQLIPLALLLAQLRTVSEPTNRNMMPFQFQKCPEPSKAEVSRWLSIEPRTRGTDTTSFFPFQSLGPLVRTYTVWT